MRLSFRHHAGPGEPWTRAGQFPARKRRRQAGGFILTFWEVLISVVIVAMVFGVIINGYLATAVREEWSGYSLAAQSLGNQTLEQARSAAWDIATGKNEITNMTLISATWNATTLTYSGYSTNVLDVPYKGTNNVMATSYVTIQTIYENMSSNVPVQLQVVRVDTVWPFTGWGNHTLCYYTNSICTFLAPDNRDPSTLGVGGN
jgi:Tfp pilus assembly protein PilV